MKKYSHLFFDLDRTIWDFDQNSQETFKDIFHKYDLQGKGISSLDEFIKRYNIHNNNLWELYRNGEIEKELLIVRRFLLTLEEDYIRLSPMKTKLFPNALETLSYLKGKYHLHIITNGFEEVQLTKVKFSGLDQYFESIITSEEAGFKKPHRNIFIYALEKNKAKAECSLMIGDDPLIDVKGAKEAGIDQVLVNNDGIKGNEYPTYEIFSLSELMEFL